MWTLQGHWQALLKHDVLLNGLKGGHGLKKRKTLHQYLGDRGLDSRESYSHYIDEETKA